MFLDFFYSLKQNGLPVSLHEYLTLMQGLEEELSSKNIDDFYYLSRSILIKHEAHLDKFDQLFGEYFKGIQKKADGLFGSTIPEEWLRKNLERHLTEEEKALIKAMGGLDKLMERFKELMEEQKKRHEGGNKMIGTGGTSPFGAYGYNPEGIRMGQDKGRHGKAVKVWDKREYKNLDDSVELGTRNIKVALRRLRKWAREGALTELDLPETIRTTAHQGYLDLVMRAERHNKVKVLIFFDIGGSMDAHIKLCEELFSAARTEFKHMDFFYFHNCLYESVWKDNRRRHNEKTPTWDVLHKYPHDYKVVIVGDATMSPYEITYPGGSVEHWNEEPGAVWLERLTRIYEHVIWLNPVPERHWEYTPSIQIMKQILSDRMFPLTLEGLDKAMRELNR